MALDFFRSIWPRSNQPLGGHYQIIQKLGAGGFGHTFLAQDLHLPGQPICVIKQLKPQVDNDQALQVARRLFDTEAKVLYALGTHPQIPQLLAHFEDNHEFYLAQELIQGHSLTEEFTTTHRWSDAQVITFLGDVLGTLAVVHQQRVIHRDLKPSNLIRRQHDNRIVLIDFGAVKQASTQLINSETGISHTISIGTQGYMPNEQIAGMPQFSSDVYAVGVMGIQLLTGRHPRTITPNPTTGELDWHDYAPQVQAELVALLDRMVRYDFRARYATATDALSALKTLPNELAHAILPPIESLSQNPLQASHPMTSPTGQTPADKSSTGKISHHLPPTSPANPSPANPSPDSMELARTQPVLGRSRPSSGGASGGASGGSGSHSSQALNRTITEPSGPTELATAPHPPWKQQSAPFKRVLPAAVAVLGALTVGLILGRSGLVSPPVASTVAQPNGETSPSQPSQAQSPDHPKAESLSSPLSSPEEISLLSPSASDPSIPSQNNQPPQSHQDSTNVSPPTITTHQPEETNTIPPLAVPLQHAEQLRNSGQYAEALAHYDEAIAHYPDTVEAHAGRCYSLNFLQRYDEAIQACNHAIDLDKYHSHALWSKGYALEQQHNYKDALKLYNKAIKETPDFAEAWNNKGTVLLKLDKIREAVKAFDEAIALDPNLTTAWSNRGAALWGLQDFNAALESVEQALILDPNNADARHLAQTMRQRSE